MAHSGALLYFVADLNTAEFLAKNSVRNASSMTAIEKEKFPSPDRIALFPCSYPDELHASQAGRLHQESGNMSTRHTFSAAYGSRPFRLTQWIPTNIEAFAKRLPGDTAANLEHLLRHNTLYPLFEIFGNAHYEANSTREDSKIQLSRMQKRLVGESGSTRLCFECLLQDREYFGTPYIHRSHQIPGVNVCWRHGCRLLSACPYCACPFEPKADMVLAPWEPCPGCRKLLYASTFFVPECGSELEIGYAVFAHKLLQSSPGVIDRKVLATLYGKKLREAGFSRGALIDRIAAREAIEEHYGVDFLNRVDSAIRRGRDSQWVRSLSRSGMHDTPLSRHLLVANFLFGSAEQFLAAAQHLLAESSRQEDVISIAETTTGQPPIQPDIVKNPTTKIAPEATSRASSPLSKATSKIIAYLEKKPESSIPHLWERHHGAMKRLARSCTLDERWLEQMRAAASPTHIPAEESLASTPKDLELAKKITAEALAQQASIEKPVRMTRSFLLRRIGWKQGNFVAPERYPLTDAQLDEETESEWHYYARRIIWATLKLGSEGTSSRWRQIELSGVEYHRAQLLCPFFSTLSSNRKLRTGTVVEILREYQIPRDWEGPAPDVEFRPRGRKHQRNT